MTFAQYQAVAKPLVNLVKAAFLLPTADYTGVVSKMEVREMICRHCGNCPGNIGILAVAVRLGVGASFASHNGVTGFGLPIVFFRL